MSKAMAWLLAAELPRQWVGRDRCVVLEAGVDGRAALVALHRLWRGDATRCASLHVIVIDGDGDGDGRASPRTGREENSRDDPFVAELAAVWPGRAPNLHRLSFDDGAFVVLWAPLRVELAFAELVAEVDVFHLSGRRADTAALDRRAMKGVARLAAPGARLIVDAPTDTMRAGLVTAGFVFGASVDATAVACAVASADPRVALPAVSTLAVARHAPRVAVRDPRRSNRGSPSSSRHALVIGAGLAGCATAWALAESGWRCTLIDNHATLAAEASGNPAGLFHGIFNRQDGRHARFNRAAALEATKAVRVALASHGIAGAIDGVLRLDDRNANPHEMAAAIDALGLPRDYIEALDAAGMSVASGIGIDGAGWFYPGGGWVDPAGLCRSFIERAGSRVVVRSSTRVERMRRVSDGWQLLDARGDVIETDATVVLANAGDALRLIDTTGADAQRASAVAWPISRVRGQLSVMPRKAWPNGEPPRLPLTGAGYVVAIDGDRVMFGATADVDDDASVRDADHVANLTRLEAWVAGASAIPIDTLEGRTAWRCVAQDRLPVIGAVPVLAAEGFDQPRSVPREPGLFVFTALGSRGITWAALGAATLASLVTGSPCPIEASLLDAVDPARFVSRRARRHG